MDRRCFVCGPDNPHGLCLDIVETGDGVTAVFDPPDWSQGYQGIVHGGIVSTLLDEMAVWAAFKKGCKAATGEITVRFKKSMRIGEKYRLSGRVSKQKGNLAVADAEARDGSGELIAYASVKLIRIE
jgi:uncharacterized protein (TIGR00369 family)